MVIISNFFQVILFDQLKVSFNFSDEDSSYYFFAFNCAFSFTSLFLPLLPESCNKRCLMCPSTFISAIGLLFMGPSRLIGFNNTPTLILAGLLTTGAASSIPVSLCLSEQIEATRHDFPLQYNRLVDLATSLNVFWAGFGNILGPVLGGALHSLFGFRRACDALALVTLILSLIQLVDLLRSK